MPQRWRDAPPILAYDDADIRVVFQPGGSDMLLVTFGDALALADGMRFAADALVRKHGLACLGFMAHQANWFPADVIARALPHVAYTLKSFRRVLAYGGSMGAYAAITHSAALGATEVLALGPQWSIDAAQCCWPCGYEEFFRPRMAGMGIRAADLAGRIAVFYDPGHALDRRHADAIAALSPSVTRVQVPNAGHHLVPVLAGSDAMFALMQAWLAGDMGALRARLAQQRRPSPVRIGLLLDKVVQRHPALAVALLERLDRSGRIGLVEAERHLAPLLRRLLALRRFDLAARASTAARAVSPFLQAATPRGFSDLDTADPGYPPIRTVHETTIFYDAIAGALCHLATPVPPAETFGLCPASLTDGELATGSCLLVWTGGQASACVLAPGGRLAPARDHDATGERVKAVMLEESRFALAVGGLHLCAAPGGKILHDRTEVGRWESFSLGAAASAFGSPRPDTESALAAPPSPPPTP